MEHNTPLAESPRIVLTGIRNAGKSSLMNNLFGKDVSIVSPEPGTTTDPVTRKIELGPLGPAAVTDTAGIDDPGDLGTLRVRKSSAALRVSDILVLVSPAHLPLAAEEQSILDEEVKEERPLLIVLTHGDRPLHPDKEGLAKRYPSVKADNATGEGIEDVRRRLAELGRLAAPEPTPVEGLVSEGDTVLLVTPIDLAAPKGRLILPQVETIRDLLDKDCSCMVVKERELYRAYRNLKEPPKLVITDSQAFHKVAADVPESQMLTSFSILFARKKGDLAVFLEGVCALSRLPSRPRVLVLEACSHHRQADDIGTVKIPRLFRQLVAAGAEFGFSRDFPEEKELAEVDLVIHCASCMLKRRAVLSRLQVLGRAGVPVVNYGLFLAWTNGLLPRVLEPFPVERGVPKPQRSGVVS
jgi:[FeFe] hydrogenase H-cluster maturation GTPase HydF